MVEKNNIEKQMKGLKLKSPSKKLDQRLELLFEESHEESRVKPFPLMKLFLTAAACFVITSGIVLFNIQYNQNGQNIADTLPDKVVVVNMSCRFAEALGVKKQNEQFFFKTRKQAAQQMVYNVTTESSQ